MKNRNAKSYQKRNDRSTHRTHAVCCSMRTNAGVCWRIPKDTTTRREATISQRSQVQEKMHAGAGDKGGREIGRREGRREGVKAGAGRQACGQAHLRGARMAGGREWHRDESAAGAAFIPSEACETAEGRPPGLLVPCLPHGTMSPPL